MKALKCSEMGGPATCDLEFKANTSEEMIGKGWAHIQEAHPDVAKNIMSNPKEVNDKWMAEFHAKFDSLPDTEG